MANKQRRTVLRSRNPTSPLNVLRSLSRVFLLLPVDSTSHRREGSPAVALRVDRGFNRNTESESSPRCDPKSPLFGLVSPRVKKRPGACYPRCVLWLYLRRPRHESHRSRPSPVDKPAQVPAAYLVAVSVFGRSINLNKRKSEGRHPISAASSDPLDNGLCVLEQCFMRVGWEAFGRSRRENCASRTSYVSHSCTHKFLEDGKYRVQLPSSCAGAWYAAVHPDFAPFQQRSGTQTQPSAGGRGPLASPAGT